MKRGESKSKHSDQHYQPVKDDVPGVVYRHTWEDILKHTPDPDAVIMGRSLLKRGAMTQFVGWTGEGKSVAVIQLAMCVATGTPFFGIEVAKPRRVLYIQLENDMDMLHEVGPSIAKRYKMNHGLLSKNLRESTVYGVSGIEFSLRLDAEIEAFQPDLVIIDPYQDYMGGDINSSEAFNEWFEGVARVMKQKRVAVLAVVHGSKAGVSQENRGKSTAYSSAGTSRLSNVVRTSVELNVREDDGRYPLRFSKNPRAAGLVDSAGMTVNTIFLHQAKEPEIYWELAESQSGGVSLKPFDRLVLFFKENPDAGFAEADKAGVCSRATLQRQWKKAKSWAKSQEKK